jgi:hypothetical protein
MTKTAVSGSIGQRHGSADPDPYQNVTDQQQCDSLGNSKFLTTAINNFFVIYIITEKLTIYSLFRYIITEQLTFILYLGILLLNN